MARRPRTLVTFHAHPDDEAIACGGIMAKYASEGHRVVLVVATRGEYGEVPDGFLEPGEELWQRRVEETHAAAEILGVSRVEFLDYVDSGMAGMPANGDPDCFWQANVEEAAGQLAAILEEEGADVLTAYDENGVYGHPDHVQVNRVGVRAARLAGTRKLYLNTVDIDLARQAFTEVVAKGIPIPGDLDPADLKLGVSGDLITTVVDVGPFLTAKRAAMAAHASQISETSFFLTLDPPLFATVFGTESFILDGAEPGTMEHDLLESLE